MMRRGVLAPGLAGILGDITCRPVPAVDRWLLRRRCGTLPECLPSDPLPTVSDSNGDGAR